jgi:hypothetical protein
VLLRRIITLAIALATLGSFSPASAVGGFGDVEAGRYYTDAVQWMVDEEITTGTGPTCFSPDGLVTRGQAAAFLHRMAGEPVAPGAHPFADVTLDWQIDAVSWMFAVGITTGTSATTYAPNMLVSRGELAALLHRYAGEPAAEPHHFVDVTKPWQQGPVSWMSAEEVTTGTSATTYSPDLPLSRAQLATFLHRYSGRPPVVIDAASPRCDDGSGDRSVTETDHGPFATTGPVTLHFPATRVELLGYHESSHDGSQTLDSTVNDVPTTVMETRRRGTDARSAADIAVEPDIEIRSPVTGTVLRAGGYTLYCDHRDEFVVIEPDDRPGWEVKVFHFEGLAVSAGDRVIAGVSVIGSNAAILPFVSQIEELTASPSWPHVHVEVIDPSIPDRPSSGGGC